MTLIVAHFTASGVPLVGPAVLPTIRIRRADTGALVVTDDPMTELGDGAFSFTYATDPTLDYSIRADGDPTGANNLEPAERFVFGAVSGVSVQSIDVEIPEILDWSKNRRRIDFVAGPPRQLVLYERDGITEKYRMDLTTTNGAEVLAFFGVQHERGVPS